MTAPARAPRRLPSGVLATLVYLGVFALYGALHIGPELGRGLRRFTPVDAPGRPPPPAAGDLVGESGPGGRPLGDAVSPAPSAPPPAPGSAALEPARGGAAAPTAGPGAAGSAAARPDAKAVPGARGGDEPVPWWRCDLRRRRPLAVQPAPGATSVSLALDLAVAGAQGREAPADLRLGAWDGTRWHELPWVVDPAGGWGGRLHLWFAWPEGRQVFLYDDGPDLAPPSYDERDVFWFADFFSDGRGDLRQRGWHLAANGGELRQQEGALVFARTADRDDGPLLQASFPPLSGRVQLRAGLRWTWSLGGDRSYGLHVQLGDGGRLAPLLQRDPAAMDGVGPAYVWGNPRHDRAVSAAWWYVGKNRRGRLHPANGWMSLRAEIDVAAQLADVYLNGEPIAAEVPFASEVSRLDTVRIAASSISDSKQITDRKLGFVIVRPVLDPEPQVLVGAAEASPCAEVSE